MIWDSVVTTVTRYELDCPGNESWWWPHFLHLSRPVVGPTQPPTQWVSFPELNWPGHGLDQLPTSSAKVKEIVEQYLFSPSGSSRVNFTLNEHNSISKVMQYM